MKCKDYILYSVIFIMPFLRGGYFYHSTFLMGAIGILLLGAYIKENKHFKIPKDGASLSLIGILFLYGINIVHAIDPGMAFLGFLKYLVFLIYYLVFVQVKPKARQAIMEVVVISAILMACLSLLSVFISPMKAWTFQNNRMGGFIQYANSFAMFMLISSLFALVLKKKIYVYLLPLFIACIYLTFSRSMYIISTIALLIAFIYTYKTGIGILKVLLVFPIGGGMGYLLSKWATVSGSIHRIKEMSFTASEWQTRLIYYLDSLNILKEHPFGTGYMGYYYIQRAYQTGVYFVKFVHSSILQTGLDIGILGILCFGSFYFFTLFNQKLELKYKYMVTVLLAHSAIDFDLEFTFFWMIILLLISYSEATKSTIKISVGWFNKGITAMVCLLYSYFFLVTGSYYLNHYKLAYRLYPYYTDAAVKTMMELKDHNIDKTMIIAEEIIENNKYVYEANKILRDTYYARRDYLKAQIYGKEVITLHPLNVQDLEKYAEILLLLAKSDIIKNDEKLEELLNEIINLENRIDDIITGLNPRAFQVKHVPKIQMTERLVHIKNEAIRLQSTIDY